MSYPKLKEEAYSNFGGINQKASRYLTGINEVLDLVNYDFSVTGAFTRRPGTTLFTGSTVQGSINGLYEFQRLSGLSQVIATANTNAYAISGGAFSAIRSGLLSGGIFDFVTFVDRLFMTNGTDFFKYDGANATNYSLPPGPTLTSITQGASFGGGFSGVYQYAVGYLNDRGYFGPAINILSVNATGCTQMTVNGLTTPAGFGITAIVIYRTDTNLTTPYQIGFATPGASLFVDTLLAVGTRLAPSYLWFTTAPNYLDLFNNQLFLIGFSGMPSTSYFSDIGEPEGVGSTAFFEVRTNDGDYLSGSVAYGSELLFYKTRSFHSLRGDNPLNYYLTEKSTQYGLLSNRATVVFEQRNHFLDYKGIVEYNGANIGIISDRMEPIFKRMNSDAAKRTAVMVHVKDRNEIWTAIPLDGATFNNAVVIYDYVANAWGQFDNLNISSLTVARANLSRLSPVFGDYSGSISYMGASLFSDNGRAFTHRVRFPFKSQDQHSTEHFWRRLWIDADPNFGATYNLLINLYANQGNTASYSTTLTLAQFQNRIDFGVSSKDLSVEIIGSDSSPLRLNGYTIAHRFQRDV